MSLRTLGSCLVTIMLLAPLGSPGAAAWESSAATAAHADARFEVECSKSPDWAGLGERASPGPFRVGVDYSDTGSAGPWRVRCMASGLLGAFGYGGLVREVFLRHDADDDGSPETLAACGYDGVLSGGCEASLAFEGALIYDSGEWVGWGLEPAWVRVCLGDWVVAHNVPGFDPAGLTGSVSYAMPSQCRIVSLREDSWWMPALDPVPSLPVGQPG